MIRNTIGLYKGIEQHRNVLYFALWLQNEGTEKRTIYGITITRSNRGNIHTWNGPEPSTAGAKVAGFATGKPQTVVIGMSSIDSITITDMARTLNEQTVLQPHDFIIALLRELESCEIYRSATSKLWSVAIQEMWDTQDIIIPTQAETERRASSYGTVLTKKYNSLHQTIENCPTTDGIIEVREQKRYYDPRSPPGTDPVNDGFSKQKSRSSSPVQSPTKLQRVYPGGLTRAATMPILTRTPHRLQTRFGYSVPPATRHKVISDSHDHTDSSGDAPDPQMRPFEARKCSYSPLGQSQKGNVERRKSPPVMRLPRSKTDRRRNESSTDQKVQQVEVVKTVLKVLAATAMTMT